MLFQPLTNDLLVRLTAVVGPDHISVAAADRRQHAGDMSYHPPHLPEVVAWPTTAAQVAALLALAHAHRLPVTAWGAGTSLEGNPIPWHGGLSLSLARMQAVVALHAADFQVTVQPGLGYKDLNRRLAPYGLFFPPDPGANASVGGMLANNAAGIRTVKYGATRDNVLRLEVALADGRLIRTGSRSIKQSSGYDLRHLFVGSEGTLGIITEATLRLTPVPTFMSAVVAAFPDVTQAIAAVVAVRGSGVDVAALDFIDAATTALLAAENGLDLPARPTLLLELHAAHAAAVEQGLALVQTLCAEAGASHVTATADPTARRRLWHARHHAYESWRRARPECRWMPMDVAVPISRFPELVAAAEAAMAAHRVEGYMIGHAGDGNLHLTPAFRDEDEYARARLVNEEVVQQAVALGGTITGEHGVGVGKGRFLRHEHGAAVDVMRAVKRALDPHGILNPGKMGLDDG